jgi:hypothetical protein
MPLLETELGRFLTEFSRLVRVVQYEGLLLPQPASAISATAATVTAGTRNQARAAPSRELSRVMSFKRLRYTVDSFIDGKDRAAPTTPGCGRVKLA